MTEQERLATDSAVARREGTRVTTLRLVFALYAISFILPAVLLLETRPGHTGDSMLFGYECLFLGLIFCLSNPLLGVIWAANELLILGMISLLFRRGWLAAVFGLFSLGCGLPVFLVVHKLMLGGYVWLASLGVFLVGAAAFSLDGQRS